jgi:hypothetical protein
MAATSRSRQNRARLAMWLTQPRVIFGWIVPFGVLAFCFFVAILVSLFLPTVPLVWFTRIGQGFSGLLFLTLLFREVVLQQGWMPVSRRDLEDQLDMAQQPYALQEALAHALHQHRWLTWAEVWAMRGRPKGIDVMIEGHGWTRRQAQGKKFDQPARARDLRWLLPLPVARHTDATLVEAPTQARRRSRT